MVEALNLERMFVTGNAEKIFEDLLTYARATLIQRTPLSKDPAVQQKLVDLAIEIRVARNFIKRVVWLQDNELPISDETAVLKVFIGELYQKTARTALEILGPYGQLRRNSKYAVLDGLVEHFYRATFVMTIGGGTSEIMRNTIAVRGLGLPR